MGVARLLGLLLRFHLKTGERTVTRDFFYYSFPQPNNPIFAPGQSRLITPLKESNAVAHGRARRSTASARSVAETQVIADLAATQNIHVVVDLVIAQDGSTAGTDEARTIQQMTAQTQAYHDMASEALTRLNGGSDAQVTEWLTTLSRRRVPPRHKGETADQYAAVQQSVATGWLGYIRSGKRSELMSKLTTITTGEDRTFTFLKSIHGGLQ